MRIFSSGKYFIILIFFNSLTFLFNFSGGGNKEAREDQMYRNMDLGEEEEALEDDDAILHEEGAQGSEEGDGDDLLEDMEKDYENKPELDRYESDGIDDERDQAELGY